MAILKMSLLNIKLYLQPRANITFGGINIYYDLKKHNFIAF